MDLAEAERRCIALALTGEDAEALNVLFGEYGRRGGKVNQQAAELERLRAAAVALLDAMTADGHYSDPAGSDERTEAATMRLSRLVR